ncbi:MAG: uroporphyrinogen-III C-methyltransferase [Ponticaulis sp.]|nr:uroporphyrinogen-III C-methyltransferase [Ponticaulis sp.]
MDLFPVFFGTSGLKAVVFGGDENARRKVRLLARTKAEVSVIADSFVPEMTDEFENRVQFLGYDKANSELSEAGFAIIAEEEEVQVQKALKLARDHRLPVNVVDRPKLCDFTVPSILDRGSVVAAVATGGAAPILARDIRARLESLMPERLGELADFARSYRDAVKSRFSEGDDRRVFWEGVLRGPVAELVLAGKLSDAHSAMMRALEDGKTETGVVHIVGAGPGDPELLTLKAFRILQDADIVYYDKLVGEGILNLIRRDADRVPVGKSKGNHSVPQEDIHRLLVGSAKEGKRVVRLKGGDPFIFGRGGEELAALQAEDVVAHVIPGISSALGCAASSGIPLTHRDHAQSVTFVTGHARSGEEPDLDWPALARENQTVVVYMGVGTSGMIAERLTGAGRDPMTPVAVIENGTRENEIRVFGRLGDLASLVSDNGIIGPALLIIGEVAGLTPEAIAALTAQMETAA